MLIRLQAFALIFRIAIYKFCVLSLLSFLFFVLVGSPDGFIRNVTGVEDIASRKVLIPLHEGVHGFVRSVRFLRIISDCGVNPVRT